MKKFALLLIVVVSFLVPWLAYGAESSAVGSASSPINDMDVVLGIFIIVMGLCMYLLSCLVVAAASRSKGYNGIGFCLYSIAFTPIFGILCVIAFAPKKGKAVHIQITDKPEKIDKNPNMKGDK